MILFFYKIKKENIMKKIVIGLLLLQMSGIFFGSAIKAPTTPVNRPASFKKSDSKTKSLDYTNSSDVLKDIDLNESSTPAPHKTAKVKLSSEEIDAQYVDVNKPEVQAKKKFLEYVFWPAKKTQLKRKDLEITPEDIDMIQDTNTLSLQEFNFIKSFMVQARQFAIKNKVLQDHPDTLGASYEASLPDTQAVNYRIRNFNKATRIVSKSTLAKIKSLESKQDLTVMDKRDIVESLIQDQLNTVLGTDSLTGEVKNSFYNEIKKELVDTILQQKDLFDPKKSDTARLQAIAKCSDKIMNKVSNNPPIEADFSTTIDAQGTYTTSMKKTGENGASIETRSSVNVDGVTIMRTMIVDNADGNGEITFITTTNPKTGISRTSKIKPLPQDMQYVANENETISDDRKSVTTTLTSAESKMTNLQFALFQSMILGKFMLKISLWSTKQLAWNAIINPIVPAITLGCIVPLGLVVKTGANFAGYKQSDPTILATFGTVVDFTMGNRRAILSNSPDRVFTKGSTISNAINFVNPLGTKEGYKADPNAEYFGAEAALGSAIVYGIKQLFPDRFGDRLISKANLKKSQEIDNPKTSNLIENASAPETSSGQIKTIAKFS